MQRSLQLLSIILALSVLVMPQPQSAQAVNIKNVTEQIGVTLGLGSVVDMSDLAIPQRFHRKADQFEIYVDMTENLVAGGTVSHGSQRVLISSFQLISPDGGPNGRALYSITWVGGPPTQAGSSFTACAQVFRLSDGRAFSDLVCNELDPSF